MNQDHRDEKQTPHQEHAHGSPADHRGGHGAMHPRRFDPARAARLDDPARFDYLPPEEVFDLMGAPRGGVVIDFGTGTGTYAIELARRRPDLEVVALDVQPEMLDRLKAKPVLAQLGNLKPVLTSDSAGLDSKADRVLSLNVLHELDDDALKGLAALLKPGGVALIADWNAEVDRPAGPPKEHLHTPAEGLKRVEKVGLRGIGERLMRYHYIIVAERINAADGGSY